MNIQHYLVYRILGLEQEGEDKGKVFLVIADRLEEFKTYFKEQKENEKNNGSDTDNNISGDNFENSAEGSENNSDRGQE